MTAVVHEDFAYEVADVYEVSGRGTVVAGRVVSGVLRGGSDVEVWDGGAPAGNARAWVVFACRPGGRTADPGRVDLFLRDVVGAQLRAGMTLRRRAD